MALVVRDLLRRVGFLKVEPASGSSRSTLGPAMALGSGSSLRRATAPAALHAATRTSGIHDRMQGRARGRLGRRSWPSGSIALMTAKASGEHLILTAFGMGGYGLARLGADPGGSPCLCLTKKSDASPRKSPPLSKLF